MNNPLTNYDFLSNKTLVLPTELLQVGLFRNTPLQNTNTIIHNLTSQSYQLDGLHCDTFVETPLFSMLLVEYHNYYLDPNNSDNDDMVALSLNRGSKLFKQLKMKGNYTIAQLMVKIETFIEKFKDAEFYLNDEAIPIFEALLINPNDMTLRFEFDETFIDYLNERGHALTFIQCSDFVAIKRKTQVPLFLLIQSIKGLKLPFFTKRYITDILGIKGDQNKKLSVAFSKLKEKHVLSYEKQVCQLPGIAMQFSRFNISNVEDDFVSKIHQDKATEGSILKPLKKTTNTTLAPKEPLTEITPHTAILDDNNETNVVCFSAFKQRKMLETKAEENLNLNIDELDAIWSLAVSDKETIAYKTENGALSLCKSSQSTENMMILTPEIINNTKIKPFIFQ